MKRTIIDCDGCGQQDIDPIELSLCDARQHDGAGSMDDFYKNFDLCQSCAVKAFVKMKSRVNLSYEDAAWLVAQIRMFGKK